MPSMMSLARATPSTSKRARSAPKMRSALSVLLAQSGGKTRVAALISRRFSSAARVRIEASQSQRTTIRTKAPMSAAALNVPRPIHLAMVSAVPLTTDERYGPFVRFATVIVPTARRRQTCSENSGLRDAEFAAVRDSEFSTDGRDWFDLIRWRLDEDGCCIDCGTPLPGVFELRPGSWGRQRQPVRLQQ